MPELPEVETVVRTLENKLLGVKILDVQVFYPKIIANLTTDEFQQTVKGQEICFFSRFGKYLIIGLERDSLIIHLRMEGKFFIKPLNQALDKHEHFMFLLSNGLTLRYHDTRKFGRLYHVNSTNLSDIKNSPPLAKLAKDANLTWEIDELYNLLQKRRIPVKVALLDQQVIAGLGNIYVNEVCFLSKVHPSKISNQITKQEAMLLTYYSKKVLDQAIESGGTTIRSYSSSLGVSGRFQQYLQVHDRENKPCYVCQTNIFKTKVGGRGTYFCPSCQVEPNQTKVIGITGGIATGKSTVSNIIKDLGYRVVDADKIVHDLLTNNLEVVQNIKTNLPEVFEGDQINRSKMAKLIFSDEKKKKSLEALLHPLVKAKLLDEIKKAKKSQQSHIFLEIPLLYETGMDSLCDEVIVVFVNEEENIKRLMRRDAIDEAYARLKINNQMPLSEKLKRATYIIDNSHSESRLIPQINLILKEKG